MVDPGNPGEIKTGPFIPAGGLKLDIGCGLNKLDGYIGIDRSSMVNADFVVDVEKDPLPFGDSSVAAINCSHLVEHLKELIPFMNECFRVLMPGGKMTILAPYYTAIQASQDPTHVRFINERTFAYFTDEFTEENRTFDYGIHCRFKIESVSFTYINMWGKEWMPVKIREWARHHLFNVAVDITVVLSGIK